MHDNVILLYNHPAQDHLWDRWATIRAFSGLYRKPKNSKNTWRRSQSNACPNVYLPEALVLQVVSALRCLGESISDLDVSSI